MNKLTVPCRANEDELICITMLQSTLGSNSQTELAQCYEAKVKEVCPINVPTTLPKTERVTALNGRSTGIPGTKKASNHEVEYPKIPSPKAPSADIPKVPAMDDAHMSKPETRS